MGLSDDPIGRVPAYSLQHGGLQLTVNQKLYSVSKLGIQWLSDVCQKFVLL